MAIDRIGKGPGLPQIPEAEPAGSSGAKGVSQAERPFTVDRQEAATAPERSSNVDAASATTPLARFRAGEVDVHGYIDLKVDEATSGLKGLSTSELDEIKSVLRDQLKSDPGLADLVHTATGKMPTPPED
jgi:hypothetical protein